MWTLNQLAFHRGSRKWGFHDVEKPLPMAEVKIMSEHSCATALLLGLAMRND